MMLRRLRCEFAVDDYFPGGSGQADVGLHLGQQDDVGSGWDKLHILLEIVVVEIGFLPDLSALPWSH